jgi:hypothetical protein
MAPTCTGTELYEFPITKHGRGFEGGPPGVSRVIYDKHRNFCSKTFRPDVHLRWIFTSSACQNASSTNPSLKRDLRHVASFNRSIHTSKDVQKYAVTEGLIGPRDYVFIGMLIRVDNDFYAGRVRLALWSSTKGGGCSILRAVGGMTGLPGAVLAGVCCQAMRVACAREASPTKA